MIRPTVKQENDFTAKYVDISDSESNIIGTFSQLSGTTGVPYFEFLRAMWICSKDIMSEDQFCKMNGNVPIKFFEKNIRDSSITKEMEAQTVVF